MPLEPVINQSLIAQKLMVTAPSLLPIIERGKACPRSLVVQPSLTIHYAKD